MAVRPAGWAALLACCALLPAAAADEPSVSALAASAGYHSAEVSWRGGGRQPAAAFSVGYCELQAWGANRCKSKIVPRRPDQRDISLPYQVTIRGLRMDTEYEVSVTPLDRHMNKDRPQARSVRLRTKPFSASTRCLAGASEVTVHTGPYFGGRLSVEDDPNEACGVQGDPTSEQQVYVLRIDHGICRTKRLDTEVRTFVTVQEQDTIQTHSTRRFLVICNYESESITVSAGVNLPKLPLLRAAGSQVQEVDLGPESEPAPSAEPPLTELGSREARQLVATADRPTAAASLVAADPAAPPHTGGSWSQMVLMLVVITGVVLGVAIGAIFSRRAALRRRQRAAASSDSASASSSASAGPSGLPMELLRDRVEFNPGQVTVLGNDFPSVSC